MSRYRSTFVDRLWSGWDISLALGEMVIQATKLRLLILLCLLATVVVSVCLACIYWNDDPVMNAVRAGISLLLITFLALFLNRFQGVGRFLFGMISLGYTAVGGGLLALFLYSQTPEGEQKVANDLVSLQAVLSQSRLWEAFETVFTAISKSFSGDDAPLLMPEKPPVRDDPKLLQTLSIDPKADSPRIG